VPRILFDTGFQVLLAAGRTPDKAIGVLDDETKREDGKLDLWCNGNQLPRHFVRQCLHFSHNGGTSAVIGPVGVGWETKDRFDRPVVYVFELDADQLAAVMSPDERGRPPSQRKEWALTEIRQMIKDGKEATAGMLRVAFETKYEPIPKRDLKSAMRQFRRWVATVKKTGRKGGQK
jgi:hypothetical protein